MEVIYRLYDTFGVDDYCFAASSISTRNIYIASQSSPKKSKHSSLSGKAALPLWEEDDDDDDNDVCQATKDAIGALCLGPQFPASCETPIDRRFHPFLDVCFMFPDKVSVELFCFTASSRHLEFRTGGGAHPLA